MRSWIRFGWARRTVAFRSSLRLKLLLPVIGGAVLLIAIIGFIFISTYNDFVWRNRTEIAQRVDAVRNGVLDKLQQADNIAQLIAKMPDLADAIDALPARYSQPQSLDQREPRAGDVDCLVSSVVPVPEVRQALPVHFSRRACLPNMPPPRLRLPPSAPADARCSPRQTVATEARC